MRNALNRVLETVDEIQQRVILRARANNTRVLYAQSEDPRCESRRCLWLMAPVAISNPAEAVIYGQASLFPAFCTKVPEISERKVPKIRAN